jgi:hypothetical protein
MKKLIPFIFLFSFNSVAQDALLEAIYGKWDKLELYEKDYNLNDPEIPESSDAEIYHWELGTPDNIPETVIIYTQSAPCGCN